MRALSSSHVTASQDSRGGINITEKRQNIVIRILHILLQSPHTQIRLSQDPSGIPQGNRECIAVHSTLRRGFSSDFNIIQRALNSACSLKLWIDYRVILKFVSVHALQICSGINGVALSILNLSNRWR
jgi:hypothetical protein